MIHIMILLSQTAHIYADWTVSHVGNGVARMWMRYNLYLTISANISYCQR